MLSLVQSSQWVTPLCMAEVERKKELRDPISDRQMLPYCCWPLAHSSLVVVTASTSHS